MIWKYIDCNNLSEPLRFILYKFIIMQKRDQSLNIVIVSSITVVNCLVIRISWMIENYGD